MRAARSPLDSMIRHMFARSVVICACLLSTSAWAEAPAAPSIQDILDDRGVPDLSRIRIGYQGPLDVSGFALSYLGAGGVPHFTRSPAAPTNSNTITAGWPPTFTPAGPGSQNVSALAVYGGDLIVGGLFDLAHNGSTALISNIAAWNGTGWKGLGGGLNGAVQALAVYDGNLIAAGAFTFSGSTSLNRVAKWNGASWAALGTGLTGGNVNALATLGTKLYVGGDFTTASGSNIPDLASWDSSSWAAVANGIGGHVRALASYSGDLYASAITVSGPVIKVSSSGTGNWAMVADGLNGTVYAMVVYSGTLVMGGDFTAAHNSAVSANRVVAWNGGWSALGNGFGSGVVKALGLSYDGSLSAGGTFSGRVSTYSGSWSTTGGGLDDDVSAVAAYNSALVCGGIFGSAVSPSVPLKKIGRWNGTSWSRLGQGLSDQSSVRALAIGSGILYAGGEFTEAAGITATRVASWNGSGWAALGTGVRSETGFAPAVHAAIIWNGNLVIGGSFKYVGGATAHRIAIWNGSSWSAPGNDSTLGLNGTVHALAVHDSELYVGGTFSATTGGTPLAKIAKWNGSSWSQLGSGMGDGQVYALAVHAGALHAGGSFTVAGGVTAGKVAKWDGSNWTSLGSGGANGVNDVVYALCSYNNSLFVGGGFTQAGGANAARLARWDGSWHEVDGGVSGTSARVKVMAVYHGYLVVGGTFSQAGASLSASNIARWAALAAWSSCGAGWDRFGSAESNGVSDGNSAGQDGVVMALAVSGDTLYVGGNQRTTDGYIVHHLSLYNEEPTDFICPAAVTDLSVTRGVHTAVTGWTQVGDDGNTGTATEADVRWSMSRIYGLYEFSNANLLTSYNPSPPTAAGNSGCAEVGQLDQCTKYYFRMRTRDEASNWSALSNLDSTTTRCTGSIEVTCNGGFRARPVDLGIPRGLELAAPQPNPVRSTFTIYFGFPDDAEGSEYDLSLFDVLGRMVTVLDRGRVEAGWTVLDASLDRLGARVQSGTYFARLRVGNSVTTRTVIVVR